MNFDIVVIYRYDPLQGCSNNSGNELMLNNNLSENLLLDGLYIIILFELSIIYNTFFLIKNLLILIFKFTIKQNLLKTYWLSTVKSPAMY